MNRNLYLKLVTLDLVGSGIDSHLFITPGPSLWSRFIGYNETIDIDHGSIKLASQLLDSSFNASPLFCLLLMSKHIDYNRKGKINIDNRNFCSAQTIIAIIDIEQDP